MNAQHHYFHPGPQDCRSYRQCHDRAYGVVAAVPTPPDAPDVEAVRWWLIERGYISTANVLTAVIDAERSAPTPPDAPLATTCPTCGSPVGRLEAAVIELRLAAVPTPPDAPLATTCPRCGHLTEHVGGWCFACDVLGHIGLGLCSTEASTPSGESNVERLAAWFHLGGWVEERGGCPQLVCGTDRTTGEAYSHVTDWQGCPHRDEHETMAHSALAALEIEG